MRNFFVVLFLLIGSLVYGRTYYLSPTGKDTNPGTITQPIFTLNRVWTLISPGDTVYLRGGSYQYVSTQSLKGKNGNSSSTIKIWAYPGEIPVITKNPTTSFAYNWTSGILFTGNYFHWKGIEISGFTQQDYKVYTGFRISDGNNNVFEQINSHHNGHGLVITGNSSGNLVLNSDFHHNQDPLSTLKYGNADGLEICYIPSGLTNTVKGCRFWWNTDDGIDLWQNDGNVIIESCWSWNNGYLPDTNTPAGDGNGFKLGLTTIDHGTKVLRVLKNCVAFNNRARGFDQNNALCSIELYNNTAYRNGTNGYVFYFKDIVCKVKNCISYKNAIMPSISSCSTVENNSFSDNNLTTPVLFDNDFVSLDGAQLMRARKSDGKLPDITFMHLAPGSDLIDAGINVGLPFSGQAPDIGAFETASPAPVVANKPPVVSISSPLKSTSFTSPATITINAAASDPDGTIIKVEFFQGTVKIGEKTTTPYSISWKEVPEGTYTLTAAATDNKSSKTVSAAVSITVVKPAPAVPAANKLPEVSITSPAKSSSFASPATVTVDVIASDPDGSITKVELFNGAVKLHEITAAPYSFTLKDLPAGSYELKAVATDNMNASSTSSSLALTVAGYIDARDYFNLYPNPNDGRFSIDFTTLMDAEIFTITIVDLIGKTVYREELSKDESTRQFDLSHLYSGTYIVIVSANQILLTQKFIKG
jgi:hypothetical protein